MSLQSERPPNASVYLPAELITDVLSFLPVKSVVRFRCVSKTFNSLISDQTFVKLHLNRFAQNDELKRVHISEWRTASFTVFRMFENPPIFFNLPGDPYYQLKDKDCFYIVGSCNGLLCLFGHCFNLNNYAVLEKWLRIWNPATRTISEKISCSAIVDSPVNLIFGYDNSSNTYKVLYFIPQITRVRVLTLGNNVWRNIQNSLVEHDYNMNIVHMRGSVIWLAIHKHFSIDDLQYAIISLDLSTETYSEFRPPSDFYEVPFAEPDLSVLKDCLCFSHYFKQTHFVIWQMKEFGVEQSWTQFLKICYLNLSIDYQINYFRFLLLCYSEKNDTLFLMNYAESRAIICNRRYNIVETINRVDTINNSFFLRSHNYIESLVWYC